MFNVGGGEVLLILLIGLIVLGPDKLPDFSRKAGRVLHEVRRMSSGFQQEIRNALDQADEAPAREATPLVRPAGVEDPAGAAVEPAAGETAPDPSGPAEGGTPGGSTGSSAA
jgi:sec-independent protein translocase protein TatB